MSNGWNRCRAAETAFPAGTKVFRKANLAAAITLENGLWHLSISHPSRDPSYYEIKDARYSLLPDNCHVAQIFPPSKEFINMHKHCFHLWEFHPHEYAQISERVSND